MFTIYGRPWNMAMDRFTRTIQVQRVSNMKDVVAMSTNFALMCSFKQTRSEADCVTPDHVAVDVLSWNSTRSGKVESLHSHHRSRSRCFQISHTSCSLNSSFYVALRLSLGSHYVRTISQNGPSKADHTAPKASFTSDSRKVRPSFDNDTMASTIAMFEQSTTFDGYCSSPSHTGRDKLQRSDSYGLYEHGRPVNNR